MGQTCDLDAGACLCLSDQGCPQGYFCNGLSSCQSLAGCNSDVDCPGAFFCDVSNQTCSQAGCSADSQCPFEQICDQTTQICIPGCRTTADCDLKRSCSDAGQCQDFCTANDFCDTGSFCNTTTGQCYINGTVYCADCSNTLVCPPPAICLQTVSEGQTAAFCGQPCQSDADCPSGFACNGTWLTCCDAAVQNCLLFEGVSCSVDGVPGICHGFQAVDETQLLYLCTDGTTFQPIVGATNCDPLSGFCNGTIAP
jgi:hypothetical protein